MKAAYTGLVFSVAALLALGIVMLYSSSQTQVGPQTQVGAHFLVMQLCWCLLGLISCGVAARMDYDLLRKLAWPIFGVAIVLLAAVLKIGPVISGARRWIVFHDIRLQSSEFAKLALIIAVAWYGARYHAQMHKFWRGLVVPSLFIAVILALVFREPDRGTMALMAATSGAMLLVAGARWRYVIPPIFAGAVGFVFYLLQDPMAGKRMQAWLHPEESKFGVGRQAYEAMVALGSGGLTGLGLGNGRQKLGFVPQHHTDFIYSIIGEELGLIGTLVVLILFVVLVICGISIAKHARDTFGMLIAFGITVLIGLQAAINVGVVTSALPNKGLPLPFISYGGSNLLIMLTCVGVLLSVARRASVVETLPQRETEAEEIGAPQMT